MAYEISIAESGYIIVDGDSVDFPRVLPGERYLSGALKEGKPVPAELQTLLPTEAKVKRKVRRIPDVVALPGSVWTVSQKLRDIIESFEPNKHEYFPIVLRGENGEELGQYYMLNITEQFDALIVGQSTVEWSKHDMGDLITEKLIIRALRPDEKSRHFAMSAPLVAGKHMWRSKHLLIDRVYCSDQFYKHLRREKITGFWFVHVNETDEQWDEFLNYGDNKWLTRWSRIVEDRRQLQCNHII